MSRPVAVITGASAGVGRATARAFASQGFDVGLVARGRSGLAAATKEAEAAGAKGLAIAADVANWQEMDAAAQRAEAELGHIDVWVNNAMTTVFARLVDMEPEAFKRATEVTYLGQVHGTMAALRRMRPRNRGHIVNVGSALSYVGLPLQAAYCGAKFACRGFFEAVRSELLAEGSEVMLSMVHLPAVNTPQFDWCQAEVPNQPQPVPPIYQPEVCAEAIFSSARTGTPTSVVGSWNRLVIAASKAFPTALAHYASLTGESSQQTGEPLPGDRPSNLYGPADDVRDYGAHGSFDGRAGGVLDPDFVKSLPATLRSLLSAGARAAVSKARTCGMRHG